ncbi:biosynthetic arginine decarboxylase [Acidithiobacillus sp. IBUN Pt1247-S3]|uniref:biosynthetic arginine decarboxylase n=1 Tax=Acidithiobacillus sp. IBUN Pt1247-S3 TaxID=3166642 RepID=UPI0034E5190D
MGWTREDSSNLYNLVHWGEGFFQVGEDGQLWVTPKGLTSPVRAGLTDVIRRLRGQNLGLPCLLRFPQILQQRVQALQQVFVEAMQRENYAASYTPVYPIKVNQQRRVVEEILQAGAGRLGLEAGSKPELLAVLALMPAGGTIICNGYKDAEYIRLALMGERLGLQVYLVVEKSAELPLILQIAEELQVRPRIGVRARLASAGAGKWQNTGGEKSKFGLSSTEILQLVAQLAESNALDRLQLLHFHLGSQIPNIQFIHGGMRECARLYAELRHLGADLQVVDVGGGLGVDYEGSHSRAYCSTNYRLEDYAQAVVGGLADICRQEELPQPQIISESGRALTAHHAVLLFNVVDVACAAGETLAEADLPADANNPWRRLLERLQRNADANTALEVYQEAIFRIAEEQQEFKLGLINLAGRAQAERLYAHIMWRCRALLDPAKRAHREVLDELEEKLLDKYFANFSLFQSLPDVWAIDQVFPIMPVHRLNERPERHARLEDITCDSDGRIDAYVTADGLGPTLPVHGLRAGEPYYLAVFLVGAYQEILGDMHNLFGDTDAVNVICEADGSLRLEGAVPGDTVAEVLQYVQFSAEELVRQFEKKLAETSNIPAAEREGFLRDFRDGLQGYTYLE